MKREIREPSIEELEQALSIEEHALEDECRAQPDSFYHVAKQLALVISRRDAAKQSLEEEEARADGDIRRAAEQEDEKVTETQVKSMVKIDKAVVTARKSLSELNLKVGVLSALKESFQQRSYALSHLVDLYIHNYYGEVKSDHRSGDMKTADANNAKTQLHQMRQRENEKRRRS